MPRQQQVTVLPDALKAWRKERQMSQAELATPAKCSEGLIAQIETGRRQPGLINAINIARALGVPLGAIAIIHADAEDVASVTAALDVQPAVA